MSRFLDEGHLVTCCVHQKAPSLQHPNLRCIFVSYLQDVTPDQWLPRLKDVDVVVNAVGIIREDETRTFRVMHELAPCALFAAAVHAGVGRVIQISALGADAQARSPYHLSKRAADQFLLSHHPNAVVLQPSLVYGKEGGSSRLFNALSAAPVLIQFGQGQEVQPVHIDDLTQLASIALEDTRVIGKVIAVVGPRPISFTIFLATLRRCMGLPPHRLHIRLPVSIARLVSGWIGAFKNTPIDRDTFDMLERGNTADSSAVREILGRKPRDIEAFILPEQASDLRILSQLPWLVWMGRVSIATVWMVTGIVSLFIHPIADSLQLLERTGITGNAAMALLYGAASLDILLGLLILISNMRLWWLQITVIAFYSVVIAWKLPEFLTHPYGPILKNVPMLALIWMLAKLEKR